MVFQITMVMVYAIAIVGLNLLLGFNGQFSLGHAAFFAIGAYTAAILMDKAGFDYALTVPVAAVVCFICGFLFGLPALRLEGLYLALATFALSVATPQILKLSPLETWTGGVQGLVIVKPSAPFRLPLSDDQWLYFFALFVTGLMFWFATNLVNSQSGRAMMAIRDNPIAARSMGINSAVHKALAFGVSALYTGVAGVAQHHRGAVRCAGQLHDTTIDQPARGARRRWTRLDPGRVVRGRVRPVRAQPSRTNLKGPVRRRLWGDPNRGDLRHAEWRGRLDPPCAPVASSHRITRCCASSSI